MPESYDKVYIPIHIYIYIYIYFIETGVTYIYKNKCYDNFSSHKSFTSLY